MEIPAELTRKLGPLPVWAWGGIAGGGLLLLSRRGGGGSAPVLAGAPSASNGSGGTLPDFGMGAIDPGLLAGVDPTGGLGGGSSFGGFVDPISSDVNPSITQTPLTDPNVSYESDSPVFDPYFYPSEPAGSIVDAGTGSGQVYNADDVISIPDALPVAPSSLRLDPRTGAFSGEGATAATAKGTKLAANLLSNGGTFLNVEDPTTSAGRIAQVTTPTTQLAGEYTVATASGQIQGKGAVVD